MAGLDSIMSVREEGSGGAVREQATRENEVKMQRSSEAKKRPKRELGEGLLAGRGIGDFTENCGATCAGCGRKVRGAVMEGFISEQSESEGFFGVNGDAELRRGDEFDLA